MLISSKHNINKLQIQYQQAANTMLKSCKYNVNKLQIQCQQAVNTMSIIINDYPHPTHTYTP